MARRRQKQKRHVPQHVRQLVFGTLLMTVIVGLGYGIHYVTSLPSLAVTEVVVREDTTIDGVAVQEMVAEELAGLYFNLIPRNFAYLLPQQSIITAIERVPRVKDVTVELLDMHTLVVSFTEYVPAALWCGRTEEYCLFLDATGYAFADAPRMIGGSLLRVRQDGVPLSAGQRPLTSDELGQLIDFSRLLGERFGLVVAYADRSYPGEVVYGLYGGAELITSTQFSNETTLKNLASILENEQFSHLRADNFKYIDLRYGNKVFVNEEIAVPEVASSTATSSAATSSAALVESE